MSQLIDWHAHILPAELVEALEQRELPRWSRRPPMAGADW